MNHHPTLSPSQLPALSQCPCYKSGEAGEAAHRGTLQHAALSAALAGLSIKFDLLPEEQEAVSWAANFIRSAIPEFLCDVELHIINEKFTEITYGSADVISKEGRFLFDYKSGLERDYSAQMKCYALGLMQKFGVQEVYVTELYGKTQTEKTYLLNKQECEKTVLAIAAAVADPYKKPYPCDYCKWCARISDCQPISERAITVGKNREDWKLEQYHSSSISDPSEMGKALTLADLLAYWCEAVKFQAKEMISKGIPIAGWKLEERSGRRSVLDAQKAFELSGLPADAMLRACTVSITKMEAEYSAAHTGLKKVLAKKELTEKIASVIENGQPILYLTKDK
jgi:hypothetical protein